MKSGRLLMFIAALVLAGCAGLEQYPETTKDYKEALRDLDPEYLAALIEMAAATTETQKTNIRDRLIEERMAVIDSKYGTFEASLTKESVAAQLGIALVGIGVGAAGSFAAETASQMLSAASGGLGICKNWYGAWIAHLFDKTPVSRHATDCEGNWSCRQMDLFIHPAP